MLSIMFAYDDSAITNLIFTLANLSSPLAPQSRMIDHEPSTGPSPPPPPRPPVAVTWSNWGPWGMCSESCGGGLKERMRSCNKITGQPGYHDCEGGMLEEDQCNTNPCPST